jgi:hypothetical protein
VNTNPKWVVRTRGKKPVKPNIIFETIVREEGYVTLAARNNSSLLRYI